MTLIVYKNNILAADSRSTHHCSQAAGNTCGHCGKEPLLVNDDKVKLAIFFERHKAHFRGEKIIAMGSSGNVKKTSAAINILRSGEDLEVAYKHFLILNAGHHSEIGGSLLMVCEKAVYVARLPARGEMVVEIYGRNDFVTIGSGSDTVRWINRLVVDSPATQLINLVMSEDLTVGGKIRYIDIATEELRMEEAVKDDPKELLKATAEVFSVGYQYINAALSNSSEATKAAIDANLPLRGIVRPRTK